jgi:hypothetical protein
MSSRINGLNSFKRYNVFFTAAVVCVAWNKPEDKLLLGCKDRSLVGITC